VGQYDKSIYVRIPKNMRTELEDIQSYLNAKGYNTSLSDLMRAGAKKFIKEFRTLREKGDL